MPLLLCVRFLEMQERGLSIKNAATSLSEEAGWSQLRDKIRRWLFRRRQRQQHAYGSDSEAINVREVQTRRIHESCCNASDEFWDPLLLRPQISAWDNLHMPALTQNLA